MRIVVLALSDFEQARKLNTISRLKRGKIEDKINFKDYKSVI